MIEDIFAFIFLCVEYYARLWLLIGTLVAKFLYVAVDACTAVGMLLCALIFPFACVEYARRTISKIHKKYR